MTSSSLTTALAAAVDLPSEGAAPDWVHLVPTAHGVVQTFDGRGPYRVEDAGAIVAASFDDPRGLPIDENHSLHLAASHGQPSPARGWVKEMEVRADGIWGRVEWNTAGRDLVAGRAYRALSPVIQHDKSGAIRRIVCASLVNRPNLKGLTALNQQQATIEETEMSFQKTLAGKLGLEAEASEGDILAAIDARGAEESPALQSAMGEIATALGVEAGADPTKIVAAAKLGAREASALVPALQAQVESLMGEVTEMKEGRRRAAAEAFVDAALNAGVVGINRENRAEFIALHMEAPERIEKLVGGFQKVPGRVIPAGTPPAASAGAISLNAEQARIAQMLGVTPEDYAAGLKADRDEEDSQ